MDIQQYMGAISQTLKSPLQFNRRGLFLSAEIKNGRETP